MNFSRKNFYIFLALLASLSITGALSVVVRGDDITRCKNEAAKNLCYRDLVNAAYEKKGLPKAFDRIAELAEADAEFAGDCHGNVHELGDFAYEDFKDGRDVEFTPKASYCGYGFYHGFMERLLQETGDAASGRELCLSLGEKLFAESIDTAGACFHGIGHGTVDGSDPTKWGNPDGMIAAALNLCESVTSGLQPGVEQNGPLYRCVTGAYNSLEILSHNQKYRLYELEAKPLTFCATQPEPYRKGCYTNLLLGVMHNTHNDFGSVVKEILEAKNEDPLFVDTGALVTDLFHEYVRLHFADADQGINSGITMCAALSRELFAPCVEGLSGGYMKYGAPTKEYEGIFSLCTSDKLDIDTKEGCYAFGLSRLRNLYSEAKMASICAIAPAPYQKYCGT